MSPQEIRDCVLSQTEAVAVDIEPAGQLKVFIDRRGRSAGECERAKEHVRVVLKDYLPAWCLATVVER